MEYLSEEHVKLLLTKEWLVKTDSESSTPYLFKFYASTVDLTCCVLITDTKNAWGEEVVWTVYGIACLRSPELPDRWPIADLYPLFHLSFWSSLERTKLTKHTVLSSNQIARRWRDCNPQNSTSFAEEDEEDAWRIQCLEFLTSAHSIGGLAELSFELAKSNFSDFAFTLGGDTFRWRWETFHLGPRMSADVLSKQLILPLISMTHIAFSSADPLGATSEADLEKSVDKVGRTARRTLDTHVRNALSKPVLATTLRRITAMFNFVPDLPRIVADSKAPDLTPPSPPKASRARATTPPRKPAPARSSSPEWPSPVHATHTESRTEAKPASQAKPPSRVPSKPPPPAADDSVTEEEPEEDDHAASAGKGKAVPHNRRNTNSRDGSPVRSVPSKRATPDQSPPPRARGSRKEPSPPASSSPPAPKKAKKAQVSDSSDEEDSEEERKKRLARLKGNATRGAKQPVKRGGRRF